MLLSPLPGFQALPGACRQLVAAGRFPLECRSARSRLVAPCCCRDSRLAGAVATAEGPANCGSLVRRLPLPSLPAPGPEPRRPPPLPGFPLAGAVAAAGGPAAIGGARSGVAVAGIPVNAAVCAAALARVVDALATVSATSAAVISVCCCCGRHCQRKVRSRRVPPPLPWIGIA